MKTLDPEEQQVLDLIRTDPDQAHNFFGRVKNLKWFPILKELKYFEPEKIQFNAEGHALFWDVLDYLERVSEQVGDRPEYGEELISIIGNLVEFSRSKKPIDNYHIWWYCVKILRNLPMTTISKYLSADSFHSWIYLWTNYSPGNVLTIGDIGEKLLPKFLSDDSTIPHAEVLIDAITQIKPPAKERVLSMRESAAFVWDSYWVIDAFKKYYQLIGQKCSKACILKIADRLMTALEYRHNDYHGNFDLEGNSYQVTVSRISNDGLPLSQIGFKEGQYECSIGRFTRDQLAEVKKQPSFFALHTLDPGENLLRRKFTALSRSDFIRELKLCLPNQINWHASEHFETRLEGIYEGLFADYSYIWIKSLEIGGRDYASGADELLTVILRDVLVSKCESRRHEGRAILELFLTNRYPFPIFKRLVLVGINKFWADYGELLEKFLNAIPNAFHESDYEVELHDVFRNHNQHFNPSALDKIGSLISDVPEYYVEKGNKWSAYWKYKWLSPLKDNPHFSTVYTDVSRLAEQDQKPYEPERSSFKGGVVVHKSPFSKDEVLQKPIMELVKYFGDFKGADFWRGTFEGEPDKEGLAEALQAAVKENPKKFTDELGLFLKADYFYLHRVLRGIKEAWASQKDIDWGNTLNFFTAYLSRGRDDILKEAFQAQGDDSGKGLYLWVVEDIVDLFESGSKDDDRAIDPKYFDLVEQVFDLVFPLLKGETHPDTQRDALTYALNTTLGRTIMAYISFSLRVARATKKIIPEWGTLKYEKYFAIGVDAFIWFGANLPQMRYLDRRYADEKIGSFAGRAANDSEWRMFIEGYLRGCGVYKDLYSLMRPHYTKTLEVKDFDEETDRRLVQHITMGYLHLGERLEPTNQDGQSSLFWKMLADQAQENKGRWLELVQFLWSITRRTIRKDATAPQEEEIPDNAMKRILAFWRWTYTERDFVKETVGERYPSFLGNIGALTILLERIDAESELWILESVPHLEKSHYEPFFIEYLTKFEDQDSLKRVGKIMLKLLEGSTPTFRQEDIELVVRNLYRKGNRSDADAICNTYGRRGFHFLKPIWEEYHQKGTSPPPLE